MARVLGVMAFRTDSGSSVRSLSRISAKTGVRLFQLIECAVAAKVIGVVITSLPGGRSNSRRAAMIPTVPLLNSFAVGVSSKSHRRSSRRMLNAPWFVTHLEAQISRSDSVTRSSSGSSGLLTYSGSLRAVSTDAVSILGDDVVIFGYAGLGYRQPFARSSVMLRSRVPLSAPCRSPDARPPEPEYFQDLPLHLPTELPPRG